MKLIFYFLFSLSTLCVFSQNEEKQLERALFNLPDVSFKKTSEPGAALLKYDLLIRQPLDHQHPEKGFFYQRVILTHKGFHQPTVMETQGYWLYPGQNEIEKILAANNLNIEYRFCGKSLPDSLQWEYLTVEQAAADLHKINQLFREIYKGKWISTGISKGGSTTIYYKYFYPADIDLAVPYVAPLDNSLEDTRIYTFLDTVGTPDIRNKIYQFQLFLLKHETEAIEKLTWYSKGANLNFTYTGSLGKSFEYAVLEYPFYYWQSDGNIKNIPTGNVLDDYILALIKSSTLWGFSDEGIKMFEAHYYQALTQCGYYGYKISPFKNYLHYFKENPSAIFPPKSATIKPFDPGINQKVQQWLSENGNNLIYIYGGQDTWTSAGILVSGKVNSRRFVLPGANHSSARIKNMNRDTQQELVKTIRQMIGLPSTLQALEEKQHD